MRSLLLPAILLAALGPLASASMLYTVDTTLGGYPIKASADFTPGNGTLSVTMSNLLANPTDIAQVIGAISFDVSGFDALSGATLASSSGQNVTIHGNSSYTLGAMGPSGWTAGWDNVAGVILLCDICDIISTDGSWPANFLIGPPGSNGTYSNANSTIAGSYIYNPFLSQSATFVLNAPGVTADSRVTAVDFSLGPHFQTEATATLSGGGGAPGGGPSPVPEPASLLLAGGGLVLAGFMRRSGLRIRRG